MKHIEVLPITSQCFNTEDILYHLTVMLTRLHYIEATFPTGEDSRVVLFWNPETKETLNKLKQLLDVDLRTISKVRFFEVDEVHDKFIALMPFEIWEEFVKTSRELGTKTRKNVARVFLYFYYRCRQQGVWGRPREKLIQDLKMGRQRLPESIQWLVEKGFLARSDYHWFGDNIYSRSYIIPDIMKAEKSSCENGKTQI